MGKLLLQLGRLAGVGPRRCRFCRTCLTGRRYRTELGAAVASPSTALGVIRAGREQTVRQQGFVWLQESRCEAPHIAQLVQQLWCRFDVPNKQRLAVITRKVCVGIRIRTDDTAAVYCAHGKTTHTASSICCKCANPLLCHFAAPRGNNRCGDHMRPHVSKRKLHTH